MADVKMPESTPCVFREAWKGQCKKPSTNGFCSAHEGKKCVSCGGVAVRSCDHAVSLVCGASLCADCHHSLTGTGHVTKAVFDKQCADREREEKESKLSRTSPHQRCDPATGLPLNLFELLKVDNQSQGFHLEMCHYLMLTHGLMGFFPAVTKGPEEIIVTTDEPLLRDVWKLLPPRRSEICSQVGYVHEQGHVAYFDAKDRHDQERSKPLHLLSRAEFDILVARDSDGKPFEWAPGLF